MIEHGVQKTNEDGELLRYADYPNFIFNDSSDLSDKTPLQ